MIISPYVLFCCDFPSVRLSTLNLVYKAASLRQQSSQFSLGSSPSFVLVFSISISSTIFSARHRGPLHPHLPFLLSSKLCPALSLLFCPSSRSALPTCFLLSSFVCSFLFLTVRLTTLAAPSIFLIAFTHACAPALFHLNLCSLIFWLNHAGLRIIPILLSACCDCFSSCAAVNMLFFLSFC